jgi:hypothetical protein
MKQCSYDEIRILALRGIGNQHCDFDKMIDIRLLRRALPTLVHMPPRRRIGGLEYL